MSRQNKWRRHARNVGQQHVQKVVSGPNDEVGITIYPSIERVVPSAMRSFRLRSLSLVMVSAVGVMCIDAALSQIQASSPTCHANPPSPVPLKPSPCSPLDPYDPHRRRPSLQLPQSPPAQPLPSTLGRHRCVGCTASPCGWPLYGLACHTCSTPSLGHYPRWLWRCCRRHRQPRSSRWPCAGMASPHRPRHARPTRPSHHQSRWCLYRLVCAFPAFHLFLSRGLCCREMPGSLG